MMTEERIRRIVKGGKKKRKLEAFEFGGVGLAFHSSPPNPG